MPEKLSLAKLRILLNFSKGVWALMGVLLTYL